jgi:salicylate hydroxylase
MEDVGLLIDLLEKYNPSAGMPSLEALDRLFTEFEQVRIPRTAELVQRAREHGDARVVSGTEACLARNKWYLEMINDEALRKERFTA